MQEKLDTLAHVVAGKGVDLMETKKMCYLKRKNLISILVVSFFCAITLAWTCWAATYYVRPDGGNGDQCTGLTDAPYPGSGIQKPCAWAHPFWSLDSSGNWKILGGDTVMIYPGSYRLGIDRQSTPGIETPNTDWCNTNWPWDCHLPPLPSGPDPDHPTRILGVGWDQGCPNPPELWGSERPWQLISLDGTSHVVIECLRLTDHSGCVEFHAKAEVRCERDAYPYGDWASAGIYAADSSNVTLKNLNIHGFASAGIRAGRIADWAVENVRIAGNGWVGWEGDIDGEDINSGTLAFKNWLVEWNGCAENYPAQHPNNCWAQSAGGYGDGVGTGATGGHWMIEDAIFRYNTSDGLDLLYARFPDSRIEIRRTKAYGNAGNQIKVNGPTLIENSLILGNCGFFDGKPFTYNVDNCRAGGTALALTLREGVSVSVINSTIGGEGDCLCIIECNDSSCNGSETIIIQNNIFRGYRDFLEPSDTACYLWFDRPPDNKDFYTTQIDYNIVFGAKIGEWELSANEFVLDPLVMNDHLEAFDGRLRPGSPAINSGLPVASLGGLVPNHDIEGIPRPRGKRVDRGAYEYGIPFIPWTLLLSGNKHEFTP